MNPTVPANPTPKSNGRRSMRWATPSILSWPKTMFVSHWAAKPTFVSIDNMDGEEWNFTAVGPEKRRLSEALIGA